MTIMALMFICKIYCSFIYFKS